ncbi:MAG: response regulator [Candidatus Limiplasma sp.]|nr:response regulator [Candidatus Limiplasma sp.]
MYRLLLVDDEPLLLEGIARMMDWEAEGFTIVGSARSAAQALDMLTAVSPDIVLTDIRMPEMDGVTLTRELRRRTPGVAVVVLSGYNDFDYVKDAFKAGARDYVYKAQMSGAGLLDALRGALKNAPPPAGLGGDPPPQYQGVLKDITAYIRQNYQHPLSLGALALRFHLNKSYLCQLLKSKTGMSFTEYLSNVRMNRARELLRTGDYTISGVSEAVGFQSFSYFCKTFKENTGMTPSAYCRIYFQRPPAAREEREDAL